MARLKVGEFLHAKLDVRDIEASMHFYCSFLGLDIVVRYDLPNGAIVQLSATGRPPGIELWYESDRVVAPAADCHIAFKVNNTRELVEQLRADGVEIAQEPFEIGHETIAFIKDPDGYFIELNQSALAADM